MKRRTFLAGAGIAFSATFAGCLGDAGTGDNNDEKTDAEGRVKECEKQYIQTEVVTRDDGTIDDSLQPTVVDSESRDDGAFVELRTEFGVTRETDGEPDEHLDYRVTASYFVTNETVYRTEGEEAEGDPRDGTTVNC